MGSPTSEKGRSDNEIQHQVTISKDFHMGKYVVAARDASGLANPAAWAVLERRGVIKSMFPLSCVLTQAGRDYDAGLRGQILHGTNH